MTMDESTGERDVDMHLQLLFEQLAHKLHTATSAMTGTLASSQQRVLFVVGMLGETTQQRLLDELELAPASLSELLTKLEKKGYITRERLEQDKRIVNVGLTAKGIEKNKELAEARRAATRSVFAALDVDEREELCRLLERVCRPVEEDNA